MTAENIKCGTDGEIYFAVSESADFFHIFKTFDTAGISYCRFTVIAQKGDKLLIYSALFPLDIHSMYQKLIAIIRQQIKVLFCNLNISKSLPGCNPLSLY